MFNFKLTVTNDIQSPSLHSIEGMESRTTRIIETLRTSSDRILEAENIEAEYSKISAFLRSELKGFFRAKSKTVRITILLEKDDEEILEIYGRWTEPITRQAFSGFLVSTTEQYPITEKRFIETAETEIVVKIRHFILQALKSLRNK